MDWTEPVMTNSGEIGKEEFLGFTGKLYLPIIISIGIGLLIAVVGFQSGRLGLIEAVLIGVLPPSAVVWIILKFFNNKPPGYAEDKLERLFLGKDVELPTKPCRLPWELKL